MPMGAVITRLLWGWRLSGCFLIGFSLALQDENILDAENISVTVLEGQVSWPLENRQCL